MDSKSSYADLVSCLDMDTLKNFLTNRNYPSSQIFFEWCGTSYSGTEISNIVCTILPNVISTIVCGYLPERFNVVLGRTKMCTRITIINFAYYDFFIELYDNGSSEVITYLENHSLYIKNYYHPSYNSMLNVIYDQVPYVSNHDELLKNMNNVLKVKVHDMEILNINIFLPIFCVLMTIKKTHEKTKKCIIM